MNMLWCVHNMFFCLKSGMSFNNNRSLLNHIRHIYKGYSLEEIYKLEHPQFEISKCLYCNNLVKFKTFTHGYGDICNSKGCLDKYKTEINQKIAKNLKSGIDGYDNIILENKDLFISAFNGEIITDPYDNKIHNNNPQIGTRYITNRSETSLQGDYFFDYRICLNCGQNFRYNIIREDKKVWCSPNCASIINLNTAKDVLHKKRAEIKSNTIEQHLPYDMDDIEFSYFCSKLPHKLSWVYNDVRNDSIKKIIYLSHTSKNKTTTVVDDYSKLCCSIVTYRNSSVNYTLQLLYNVKGVDIKPYINDIATCSVCNNTYTLKPNFVVDNTEDSATKFNYCSQTCYFNFLKSGSKHERYPLLSLYVEKQSLNMRNKILNGTFTPNTTSYYNNIKYIYKNIKFRSSWEIMFYEYAISKYNTVTYENIRIPYYDNKLCKNRVYILDFILDDAILVEVKPRSHIKKNIDKLTSLSEYAIVKNYTYFVCDELFLRDNISELIFEKILSEELDPNVRRLILQYRKTFL